MAPSPTDDTSAVRAWRLALVLLGVEAVATLLDVRVGPGALVSAEERLNAQAGVQIACGHLDALWDLQAKAFCGGCTTEALLAAPVFGLLGTSVAAWKVVPAGLHLLLAVAGAGLARRLGGGRAAAAFAALVLGAPAFWRDLSLTGFGNHAEVGALVLAAAALLAAPRAGLVRAAGAGLVAGFAAWFCATSVHALPALLLAAALLGWRQGLAFLGAFPLGLLPAWVYHRARPDGWTEVERLWRGWELAPPAGMVRWLWSDLVAGGLLALPAGASAAWWALLWGTALAGCVLLVRRGGSRGARLFVPLALVGLIAAWVVRYDLWDDNPVVRGFDPFNLRYRAPLIPLLLLGAAVALAAPRRRVARMAGVGALALLCGLGVWQRASRWSGGDGWRQGVYEPVSTPDPTVPLGSPPQRLARAQGRPVDIEAARTFLARHEDRLAECRRHHLYELGRREGIALSNGASPTVGPVEEALAAGLGRSVALGADPSGAMDRLSASDPALVEPTARAAGSWLAEHGAPPPDDARLLGAWCAWWAEQGGSDACALE